MQKKCLLEFTAPQAKILDEAIDEKTGDRTMRVEVKWQHAGVINGNGRRYPREVMNREIERLQPMITEGRVFGASYHPKGDAEVRDISHIWESISMDTDGSCVGIVKVLPTNEGRNAQVIIKNGGRIGLSSRGYGSTTKKEEIVAGRRVVVDEINPDYTIKSPGDFVLTPSVPDASTRQILENRYETEDSKELSEMQETEEMDKKEYKSLEELKADFGALIKPLDDELATLKEQNKTLGDKIVALEGEKVELQNILGGLGEESVAVSEVLREVAETILEIPGVMPEDEGTRVEGEPETDVPPIVDAPPTPPEGQELVDAKAKADAEKKRADSLEAELTALKTGKEAEAQAAMIKAAFGEALKNDTPEYKVLIEAELVKDGKVLIEKKEDVVAKVEEVRKKISETKAKELQEKIKGTKGGIEEKGHVEDTNRLVLTEAQKQARYEMAVAAGFKGDLEKYSKEVLKLA